MGGGRTDATWKYRCARLIRTCLIYQNLRNTVVTSRDIALIFHLSQKASHSISAMRNSLDANQICEARFAISLRGIIPLRTCDHPHHFTIDVTDEARGLL